jgi:hypothetical protein
MDILTRKKLNTSENVENEVEAEIERDEQQIESEILNQQSGAVYSPGEEGFARKDAYDSLDVDSSSEIVGRNLSDS